MNEKDLLSAILYEVRTIRAKVDTTADELLNFRNEMYQFRNETNNNFDKVERRLQFGETGYNQLNQRVDKLERSSNF